MSMTPARTHGQCPICLEAIDIPIRSSPCGHAACFACITAWLHHRRSLGEEGAGDCPACRRGVKKLTMDYVVPAPVLPALESADLGIDILTVSRDGIRVRAFCRKHGLDMKGILAVNKGRATDPWPAYTNGGSSLRRGTTVWLHSNLAGGR